MKITNLDKGEAYQLAPETQLEVERTNPFFNDWGEQSVPLSIPDTPHNRRILGYSDQMGNTKKMQRVNASIQDGEFYIACKQAVLSSKHNESIQTSFYMNEGAFYANMKRVSLKEVFKDEFVPGVNTVEEAINWCRSLMDNSDPNYAIFPILVDDDSGVDSGYNYKIINAFGQMMEKRVSRRTPEGRTEVVTVHYFVLDNIDGSDFYNATQQTEVVNQVNITLTPGYYISPFVRANYVLKRVLLHFGYTLLDNFFTQTAPFNKMVLVNNVMDSIVNGKIRIAHLLPDVTCQDILDLYRKKFNCEFIPDELHKTVTIKHFSEVLNEPVADDLTDCMTEEPHMEYKAEGDYKRLSLIPSDSLADNEVKDSFENLSDLIQTYPSAYFDKEDGCFYREGFSGASKVIEKVATSAFKFDLGGDTEVTSVEIPECLPELRVLKQTYEGLRTIEKKVLYVGKYQSLNSKMLVANEEVVEDEATTSSQSKLPIMLAIPFQAQWISTNQGRGGGSGSIIHNQWTTATLSNCDYMDPTRRLWDYTLHYYGPDGIFEKFYRTYDTLLRNSLHTIKAKFLLPSFLKRSLPSWQKVMLRNTTLLINKFKYTVGGKNEPTESEFLTIRCYEPINEAPPFSDIMPPDTGYHWEGHSDFTEVDEEEYENSGADKERTLSTFFPPVASETYADGAQYFKQTSYRKIASSDPRHPSNWYYQKREYWLTCESNS